MQGIDIRRAKADKQVFNLRLLFSYPDHGVKIIVYSETVEYAVTCRSKDRVPQSENVLLILSNLMSNAPDKELRGSRLVRYTGNGILLVGNRKTAEQMNRNERERDKE